MLAFVFVHDADEADKLMVAADRCDYCGARAYVTCLTRDIPDDPTDPAKDLLFCHHCYSRHEDRLIAVMDSIHDCRALLEPATR